MAEVDLLRALPRTSAIFKAKGRQGSGCCRDLEAVRRNAFRRAAGLWLTDPSGAQQQIQRVSGCRAFVQLRFLSHAGAEGDLRESAEFHDYPD
jgi:hypothetical protein